MTIFWNSSRRHFKMDKASDDAAAAAAATAKEISDLKAERDNMKAELDKQKVDKDKDKEKDNDTLAIKAQKDREAAAVKAGEIKTMEKAIEFNMKSKDWMKNNESLLPATVKGIFEQADKQNFANAMEKEAAIKVGIVSEFFAVQANVDALTPGLKSALDEWKILIQTEKQNRVQSLYDTVFEPTFEMMKQVKKAQQLQKGQASDNDADNAYKKKLEKASRAHYLGEK